MRLRLVITCVLVALGCSTPESRVSTSPSDSAAVAVAAPGLSLRFLESDSSVSADGLRARRFSYTRTDGRWPYGWGLAVFSREPGALRWLHLMIGDSPVHAPQLVDLDGDARSDLFAHAGEETDFNTYIFLNRIAVDAFAVSNFGLGLRTDEV